jgi:hypothetical protein
LTIQSLQAEINAIDQEIAQIENSATQAVVKKLLNIIERLCGENDALKTERQQLRDEINRLKDEQGNPVSVGTDHDTSEFAVESIRRWWNNMGRARYPDATELLVTADDGGSNGYRVRLWKVALQRFANETGLRISVCHFPPGTSKWNKIEHRMFSYISMNWRGQPLISHEVIVNLIGSTTTQSGLTISAELDTNIYPKGIRVSDDELEMVNLTKAPFHGKWNYTIDKNCSG